MTRLAALGLIAKNGVSRALMMRNNIRHPEDVTHHMMRAFYVLVGVTTVVVVALVISKPSSYWDQGSRVPVEAVDSST